MLVVCVIKCCEWFNDDNMLLNYAYKLQPWISVSVQNAFTLNHTSIHIRSRKIFKSPSDADIAIFQEKWDISIVTDTLAPRIAGH